MVEIERKFLIRGEVAEEIIRDVYYSVRITQGYLDKNGGTRVRISEDTRDFSTSATLTLKSKGKMIRNEFEYKIPVRDAKEILHSMCKSSLSKTRHKVPRAPYMYEVDVFDGPLQGLYLVEVEFPNMEEATQFEFDFPYVKEVTDCPEYSNIRLSLCTSSEGLLPPQGDFL